VQGDFLKKEHHHKANSFRRWRRYLTRTWRRLPTSPRRSLLAVRACGRLLVSRLLEFCF
jgi:hypothetical protein